MFLRFFECFWYWLCLSVFVVFLSVFLSGLVRFVFLVGFVLVLSVFECS